MFRARRRVSVVGPSVVAPTKPTLTAPADNVAVIYGLALTVSATVTAGQVPDRVDFVLDPGASEVIVATDSASPYSQTWTPAQAAGAHTLVARFVYGSGYVDSDPVNLTLTIPEMLLLASSVVKTGTTVTGWTDLSGHGHTWAAAAGKEPTYQATGGPGSVPDVRFASGKVMSLGSSPFAALTAGHIYVVWKFDNAVSGSGSNGAWMLDSDTANGNYIPFSDGKIYDGFGSTARKATAAAPNPAVTSWHVYEAISTSTEWTVQQNNVQIYTTATNTVGWPATAFLGGNSATPDISMVGDIAMVLLLDHKASAAEDTAIHAFTTDAFGV